jgi:transposase, IS5 family
VVGIKYIAPKSLRGRECVMAVWTRRLRGVVAREQPAKPLIGNRILPIASSWILQGFEALGTEGDAANAILTAVGHNLRLILAWLRMLLRLILVVLFGAFIAGPMLKSAS